MADWRWKSKYEEKFANPTKQILPEFLSDYKNISLKFDVPWEYEQNFEIKVSTLLKILNKVICLERSRKNCVLNVDTYRKKHTM